MNDYESLRKKVPVVLLCSDSVKYLVELPKTLEAAVETAARLFPTFQPSTVRLETDINGHGRTRVQEGWLPLVQVLSGMCAAMPELWVTGEGKAPSCQDPLLITVKNAAGKLFPFRVYSFETVASVKLSYLDAVGLLGSESNHQRYLLHAGRTITNEHATFSSLNITSDTTLTMNDTAPKKIEKFGSSFTLFVKTLTGKTITLDPPTHATVADLKYLIYQKEGIPLHQQRMVSGGTTLEDPRALLSYRSIGSDSTLHLHLVLRGGKPVIYLFPPTFLPAARVSVTLSPQWGFCELDPVVDIKTTEHGESSVSWTVSAGPTGKLVDLASGTSHRYLFWEADSKVPPHLLGDATTTPTPAPTPAFNPALPVLDAATGCILPLALFLPYLDAALTRLTLHPAARAEFIAWWLPSFERLHRRNLQIAFRFVPQADFAQAARLDVDPQPDVVTRVFLLFKGVEAGEAEGWRKADGVDWAEEVGVELDKATDTGLFRVLEWGGMEVFG
ncbi:hypothetical protein JCM10207_009245 [Rhodosporidiobolus poonsookiae]